MSIANAIENLLKSKLHLAIVMLVAILIIALYFYVTDVNQLVTMNTLGYSIAYVFTVLVISVLAGINVALVVRKLSTLRSLRPKDNVGFLGTFVGSIASGCPVCGTGILTALGISGGLAIFPLAGFELRVPSGTLLVF